MKVLPTAIFAALALLPLAAAAQLSGVTPEELYAGGPAAPVILSDDFPAEDGWYRPQDATFYWALPEDITAAAIDLATTSGAEPMTPYRPPADSFTVNANDLHEGIQYVVVQLRNGEKWGPYAERRVQIDATPPAPFSIGVQPVEGAPGQVRLDFQTTDQLSGLDRYELQVDGERRAVPAAAAGALIALSPDQPSRIVVTAFDRAGNEAAAETVIYPLSLPPAGAEGVAGLAATSPESVLAAMLAALLLIIFGYLVYERQRYAAAVAALRQESDEAATQILRVFEALRMEIYDQINAIDGKTRLSKREKEAVAGLQQALHTSEKLLRKEVKDIEKIVR